MIVLGLTGSIGMGKTTTAAMFAEEGVPVYDSDGAVHALYGQGGAAVSPIAERFPEAVIDGAVDRPRLSALVVGRPEEMRALEAIVHPLVRQAQANFLRRCIDAGAPVVVLDIPLLFETGADQHMGAVVVVTAPAHIQRARVLARPGMTEEKFAGLLAKQMPDAEKQARADFVINTGLGMAEAREQVRAVLEAIKEPA